MTVRSFDGVDDRIDTAIGACNVSAGAHTVLVLGKRTTQTLWDASVTVLDSGATARLSLYTNVTALYYDADADFQAPALTWGTVDGWTLVAIARDAGAAQAIQFSKRPLGGAATHESGGSVGNSTGVAGGNVRFGAWQGAVDLYDGKIAVAAVFDRKISTAEFETVTGSTQQIKDLVPVALWEFNQAATTDPVNDLTSNGANQTAIVGTTAVAGDDPTWTFGVRTTRDHPRHPFSPNVPTYS